MKIKICRSEFHGTRPKFGASWKGYAIEEVLDAIRPNKAHFRTTHQGTEIDLVSRRNGRTFGVAAPSQDGPNGPLFSEGR